MNNKKKTSLIFAIIIIVGLLLQPVLAEELSGSDVGKMWGEYLGKRAKNTGKEQRILNEEIYAKGKTVEITSEELKQAVKFYELSGISTEDARKQAYEYLKQSESLYSKAVDEGFAVTEEEVTAYVEELKGMLAGDDLGEESKKQVKAIMSGFNSEEAYWEYEKKVYKKLLPSQNYVKVLENNFFHKNPDASAAEWEQYFESVKKKLVEEENIQEVSNK